MTANFMLYTTRIASVYEREREMKRERVLIFSTHDIDMFNDIPRHCSLIGCALRIYVPSQNGDLAEEDLL